MANGPAGPLPAFGFYNRFSPRGQAATVRRRDGVDDGIRTRDHWNHNPGLYQLSYVHHNRCMGRCGSRAPHNRAQARAIVSVLKGTVKTGGPPRRYTSAPMLHPRAESRVINYCRGREMARLAGLEPAAYGLEVRRSIHLSYRRAAQGRSTIPRRRPRLQRSGHRRPAGSSLLVGWWKRGRDRPPKPSPQKNGRGERI